MSQSSIREMIREYENEILKGDLLPIRASEMLIEMSALLGNVLDKITETEMLYNQVLLKNYDSEKTANRAKIKSEITDEFKNMRDAKNTEKVLLEVIRGLKYFLRMKEDEYKAGRNL